MQSVADRDLLGIDISLSLFTTFFGELRGFLWGRVRSPDDCETAAEPVSRYAGGD
jgi:hypothetical protein